MIGCRFGGVGFLAEGKNHAGLTELRECVCPKPLPGAPSPVCLEEGKRSGVGLSRRELAARVNPMDNLVPLLELAGTHDFRKLVPWEIVGGAAYAAVGQRYMGTDQPLVRGHAALGELLVRPRVSFGRSDALKPGVTNVGLGMLTKTVCKGSQLTECLCVIAVCRIDFKT